MEPNLTDVQEIVDWHSMNRDLAVSNNIMILLSSLEETLPHEFEIVNADIDSEIDTSNIFKLTALRPDINHYKNAMIAQAKIWIGQTLADIDDLKEEAENTPEPMAEVCWFDAYKREKESRL